MQPILKITKFINNQIIKSHLKYYRRNFAQGGDTVIFYGSSLPIIKNPQNIFLGNHVKINEYAYLNARKNAQIYIGDYSNISSFAKLITAEYNIEKWKLQTENEHINDDIHINKEIYIGNHCSIYSGSIILPGVKITGENVIIAAASVVTKSFNESNIILAGNPARIIKKI